MDQFSELIDNLAPTVLVDDDGGMLGAKITAQAADTLSVGMLHCGDCNDEQCFDADIALRTEQQVEDGSATLSYYNVVAELTCASLEDSYK